MTKPDKGFRAHRESIAQGKSPVGQRFWASAYNHDTQEETPITSDLDFEPPLPLTLPARRHWDRISRQIHGQGRWAVISHDLLASFCQVLAVSQECLTQILADGVMVTGSRSERDRIRHPLWTPFTQCQQTLIRLARTIPLTDPRADTSGAALDSWLDEMVAS